MTATATFRGLAPALRRVGGEALTFTVATVLAITHALGDAEHIAPAAIALLSGVAAIAAFPRVRPGLRAVIALSFGVLATANGAMHVLGGLSVSGSLVTAAGVVLIGLAAVIPFRHRGTSNWRARAVAVPATFALLFVVVGPVALGITQVHKWREPIGPTPAGYQDVTFRSTDGLKLYGWYRPSANGAAIVVAHGGGGDREGAMAHARMLARHGYGVLVYDTRGRGESEGQTNSYAWGWEKDAAGAVAFLKARPDVDRIGGLGLSSGADTLVDVAATNPDLRATVADGTALRTFEDAHRILGTSIDTPSAWVQFEAMELMTGDKPPKPLEDLIARVESPLLLISSGSSIEYDFNAHYMKRAKPTTRHWNMPDGHHTRGLREYPAEYERRVVEFFAQSLGA